MSRPASCTALVLLAAVGIVACASGSGDCLRPHHGSDWESSSNPEGRCGRNCWDPPANYCGGTQTAMTMRMCRTDMSVCCLFNNSCVPCSGWVNCNALVLDPNDESKGVRWVGPGGITCPDPAPGPGFTGEQTIEPCASIIAAMRQPVCYDDLPPGTASTICKGK